MKKTYIGLSVVLIFSLACGLFNPELFGEKAQEEEATVAAPEEVMEEPTPPVDEENPCNNLFYPLVPTQQLVYRNVGAEGVSQTGITVAAVDGNFATVDMLNLSTGVTSQSTVECDAGTIKNYAAASLGSLFDNMLVGDMEMEYVSGFIAPSEEILEANNWDMTWTSEYVMNGELTVESEGETVTVIIDDSPVVMTWAVVGTGQSLTVEAGSYTNVVQVSRKMEMDIKIDMGLMNLDSKLYLDSMHWFEPYVGMVKMEITQVNVEAQGMSFPVALDESMELIEFRPAE